MLTANYCWSIEQRLTKERANRPNYSAVVALEHEPRGIIYWCLRRDASFARGGRHYGTALSYVSSAHLRTLKDILLELLGSFGNHWDIG